MFESNARKKKCPHLAYPQTHRNELILPNCRGSDCMMWEPSSGHFEFDEKTQKNIWIRSTDHGDCGLKINGTIE